MNKHESSETVSATSHEVVGERGRDRVAAVARVALGEIVYIPSEGALEIARQDLSVAEGELATVQAKWAQLEAELRALYTRWHERREMMIDCHAPPGKVMTFHPKQQDRDYEALLLQKKETLKNECAAAEDECAHRRGIMVGIEEAIEQLHVAGP